MALISEILNRVDCGADGLLGLGNYFCPFNAKRVVTGIRMPNSFRIAPDVDFNLEYIQEQQQKGIFDVVPGIINMVDNTPENTFSTQDGSGIQALTLKSPYLWNFSFNSGLYNFKGLVTRESGSDYAWMWIDEKGSIFGAEDRQGNFRGLKTHLFSVAPYKVGNDNTHIVTVQTDRADFDTNVAWITSESLDFDGFDLTGWNDVVLNLTAPASAATVLTFSIFAKSANKAAPLLGLEATDLLITSNNTPLTLSALTPDPLVEENGKYTVTVNPALVTGRTIAARLFDNTLNASIVKLPEIGMFKSNVATTVVL